MQTSALSSTHTTTLNTKIQNERHTIIRLCTKHTHIYVFALRHPKRRRRRADRRDAQNDEAFFFARRASKLQAKEAEAETPTPRTRGHGETIWRTHLPRRSQKTEASLRCSRRMARSTPAITTSSRRRWRRRRNGSKRSTRRKGRRSSWGCFKQQRRDDFKCNTKAYLDAMRD